jgi:hypothetical protein
MLQLLFLLTLPVLLASGAALLAWNALSGPWKFFLASTVALYLLYGICMYLLAPASVGFAVHAIEPGQHNAEEPLFVYLEPYYRPLLVFAVLAVPAIFALLRAFKR